MVFTWPEINTLVGAWLWPLFRIGGMVMTAPVFGTRSVPPRVRLMLAVAITLVVAPLLPPGPPLDLTSPLMLFLIVQQVLIGVLMGFAVQLVFAAVITGGHTVAMQMGLGFSMMVDPQNGQQAPVLSQFYVLMIILVYLALNGHLVLIEVLVDSFRTLPVAPTGVSAADFHAIVRWGSHIFAGGLAMALPAVASLLLVNLAFGIMTRAAPQLNLFAIGFPVTMMIGFAVVLITLPGVIPQAGGLFNDIFHLLRSLLGGEG